ncbi:MAG: sigma-70 family RNA polymerase sigma factor [Planctomycetes bacterium]|nr:sigma-70 family RNA polymerase sigma factor [Planctomycetota bacterium]
MNERGLHRLFRRFRRKGDVQALAEVFDAVAPEIYRVATHLAPDLHAAEDLVQATFVAAIEGREGWDESRRLVPWLLGILVHQAARERRRTARVVEPERLERRGEPGPPVRAEAQELAGAVEEALAKLPPLYREVLALHLREDKGAQEIALELGRAPGTVRVQIHRALEMLRKALPAGLATGGAFAITSPRSLAAVREVVLRSAQSATVGTGAGVGTGATLIGGLVMSTKAVVAGVAAALLLGLGWLAWPRHEGAAPGGRLSSAAPQPEGPNDSPFAEQASPTPPRTRVEAEKVAGVPPPKVPSPGVRPGWVLRGTVNTSVDGKVEQTALSVRPMGDDRWPDDVEVTGYPSRDGTFEMDVSRLFVKNPWGGIPIELLVRADHVDFAPLVRRIPLEPAQRKRPPDGSPPWDLRADFMLTVAGAVSGQVLLPDGSAASGTPVGLIAVKEGKPSDKPSDQERGGADGRFRLRASTSGPYVVLALREGLAPWTEPVSIDPGKEVVLRPRTLTAGAHIGGTIRVLGRPAPAGTRVVAACRHRGDSYRFGGKNVSWEHGVFCHGSHLVAPTDASGRYLIEGLLSGPHTVYSVSLPDGHVVGLPALSVEAPQDGADIDIDFARLAFRVRTEARGLRNAIVQVRPKDGRGGGAGLRTDDQGKCSVLVPPRSTLAVRAELEGYQGTAVDVVSPGPGETVTTEIDLVRSGCTLLVDLRATDGRAIRDAGFALFSDDAERPLPNVGASAVGSGAGGGMPGPGGVLPAFVRDARSETGSFVLRDLPPGSFRLMIDAEGPWGAAAAFWVHSPVRVDLAPGGEIRRTVELVEGGRIRVSVKSPHGDFLPAHCLLRDSSGWEVPILVVTRQADGSRSAHPEILGGLGFLGASDLLPNLPPGSYELELWLEGYRKKVQPVSIEPGKLAEVQVVLEEG